MLPSGMRCFPVRHARHRGVRRALVRHPRLERYAWYPWTTNNDLVDASGGSLTDLGVAFAAAPSYR
jgi:hypothetical protein